jgi:hypothetical protein
VLRTDPQHGECQLTPDATVEVTRDATVHIHGNAARLWAFGSATVYVHGEIDEVYVLGKSNVHIYGKCRRVEVGMHGTAWFESESRGALTIADQNGTVHCSNDEVKVRAYGESRSHAPSTADVVLHWYAQWHTESEVRGNLSLYRPGYCVVR